MASIANDSESRNRTQQRQFLLANTVKNIVCTDGVCGGAPRIDGTRLNCSAVVANFYFGRGKLIDFLNIYPYLEASDVWCCLDYCSREVCVKDAPTNFCHGCVHDKRDGDELNAEREKYWEIAQKVKEELFF